MSCYIEILFIGINRFSKTYMLVGQESISFIVPKLKGALSKSTSGFFFIQYIDDEYDLVSIDSEEELIEFSKFAKQRCSEGKLLKLVVNNDQILDQDKLTSLPEFQEIGTMLNPETLVGKVDLELPPTLDNALAEQCSYFSQWKMDFKSELKQEILQELKNRLGAVTNPNTLSKEAVANEEDSDGNLVHHSGKKKKLLHNLKKLEKKEKQADSIDQRLEKLEMKRKKLLEKAYLREACRNPIGLPFIMSGIATSDSIKLSKRINVGKYFVHEWQIINDGTVPWKDVQLHHFWSSPGLDPDELVLKCSPLLPEQEGQLSVRFRAPKIVGSFASYWHFVTASDLKQFGHYVSLTGSTKLPKLTCASGGQTKLQDCKKKSKDKMKSVIFNQEVNFKTQASKSTEGVIYNNEKSLASAEIAAEMAREAAKALLRRTSVLKTDEELTNKCHEVLNLVDSASDTDVMDENEDTDPEFVIVNIPSTEKTKTKDRDIRTLIGDSTNEKKESNVIQVLKVDGNIMLSPQNEANENDNINNTNRVIEKQNAVCKEVMENSKKVNSSPYSVDKSHFYLNNTLTETTTSQLPADPFQQLHSTKLLPSGYPLQHPMSPQQRPSHTFQVFPPQATSSHVIAYPPPPTNYFPASQINPSLSYPPILNDSPVIPSERLPYQPLVFPPSIPFVDSMTLPTVTPPEPVSTPSIYPQSSPLHHSSCDQSVNKAADQTPHEGGLDVFKNFGPQSETPVMGSNSLPVATKQNVDITTENPNPQSPTEIVSMEATAENITTTDKNLANTVQILPPSLVDGAINVASHAYSTAWSALNAYCSKEGELQTFDPVFENNMALMLEMGFRNVERNARLMKLYKNDINQVVGIICASPGGDNLEID